MNKNFENFLKHIAANEKQKHTIPRLKVIERQQRRGLGNYNYNSNYNCNNKNLRSGSGSSFSSVCEKERAVEALKNLIDTFRSSSSSIFA